jgi:hypothetical protein
MLDSGVDIRYVAEMLGHAKLETSALVAATLRPCPSLTARARTLPVVPEVGKSRPDLRAGT